MTNAAQVELVKWTNVSPCVKAKDQRRAMEMLEQDEVGWLLSTCTPLTLNLLPILRASL